jgi:hypothetical protein
MNVFISWSGDLSKKVATAVKIWVENTLQNVSAFMSHEDIDKGSFWFNSVSDILKETSIGILCLTSENKKSPWILFEAGALSKGLSKSRVCPLLIDLQHSDVGQPLSQFNGSYPVKDDMEKIILLINKELGESRLSDLRIKSAFEIWWPKFSEEFSKIMDSARTAPIEPEPTSEEMLKEILEISRSVQNQMQNLGSPERIALNPYGWYSAEDALASFLYPTSANPNERGLMGRSGGLVRGPINMGPSPRPARSLKEDPDNH